MQAQPWHQNFPRFPTPANACHLRDHFSRPNALARVCHGAKHGLYCCTRVVVHVLSGVDHTTEGTVIDLDLVYSGLIGRQEAANPMDREMMA